jgi:hypothetical protein
MLLLCVVFALVTLGFVVPCVIDIATTPRHHFGLPSKQTWLVVATSFWAFGAAAWLIAGRREVRAQGEWLDATGPWAYSGEAAAAYGTGRADGAGFRLGGTWRGRQAAMAPMRFVAPDDNPDFLLELEHRIRRWRGQGA